MKVDLVGLTVLGREFSDILNLGDRMARAERYNQFLCRLYNANNWSRQPLPRTPTNDVIPVLPSSFEDNTEVHKKLYDNYECQFDETL